MIDAMSVQVWIIRSWCDAGGVAFNNPLFIYGTVHWQVQASETIQPMAILFAVLMEDGSHARPNWEFCQDHRSCQGLWIMITYPFAPQPSLSCGNTVLIWVRTSFM